MIDFHTHILPGIDDGSRNAEESTAMLQEELRQDVHLIVATPHFYADRVSFDDFLAGRKAATDRFRTHIAAHREEIFGQRQDLPVTFRVGAEIYYFPGIGRAERLKELAISGTDTVLVEMPFVQWEEGMLREISDILTRQKLQIVLAHIERYPQFQKDKRIFEEITDLPLTLQINGGSFLKDRRKRKFCLNLLKERDNVILGSDCHNMSSRRPNLQEARAVIEKKLGAGRLAMIDAAAERILADPKPAQDALSSPAAANADRAGTEGLITNG